MSRGIRSRTREAQLCQRQPTQFMSRCCRVPVECLEEVKDVPITWVSLDSDGDKNGHP